MAGSVLVTGGTGFIGELLIHQLLREGRAVTVLTRRPDAVEKMFNGSVKCISNMEQLPTTHVMDIVVNLAGARILGWHWTCARKKILVESRVKTTESVVKWIAGAEKKPELFLSASAIGYYGIQAQHDTTRLNEESQPQSIFMSTLCQEWEAAARKAAEYGVTVNIMRFGLVLGHKGALPMMLLPIKLGLGGPLASGKQSVSWIHIEDLLRAISHLQFLHEHKNDQETHRTIYNFTAPEVVSQKQFSHIAATLLHRPAFMPTPGWPLRLLLGEQSDLLLEGQNVEPVNLLASLFNFKFNTLEAALRDLIFNRKDGTL